MGKHATYQKRGSAGNPGAVGAPADADWTAGTLAAPSRITFTRLTTAPPGASGIVAQYRVKAPAGSWVQPGFNATTITTGSVLGEVYLMRIAWANSNTEIVSDWSPTKEVTSL